MLCSPPVRCNGYKRMSLLQNINFDSLQNIPKDITKKKSDALIKKIYTLTSPGQVSKLKRNNYVVDRIKPDNEQICFQYYSHTGLKKTILKNKGEVSSTFYLMILCFEREISIKGSHTTFKNIKGWWRCCLGHEWNTLISNRTGGSKCPYCSGIGSSLVPFANKFPRIQSCIS